MQDIHQCDYGTRPVQTPSPLLPKAQSGNLSSAAQGTIWGPLLGPGNSSRVKSLENPKMAPLIKIFTSLLPYPPFLHPTHSILPSSPESSPSPFSLPISPYTYPPCAPNFCLAILSTSNIQEDNYMIFLGSPSYLASLGSQM